MLTVNYKPHELPEKQLRLILNLLKDAFEENGDAPSDGVDFFENYLKCFKERNYLRFLCNLKLLIF